MLTYWLASVSGLLISQIGCVDLERRGEVIFIIPLRALHFVVRGRCRYPQPSSSTSSPLFIREHRYIEH